MHDEYSLQIRGILSNGHVRDFHTETDRYILFEIVKWSERNLFSKYVFRVFIAKSNSEEVVVGFVSFFFQSKPTNEFVCNVPIMSILFRCLGRHLLRIQRVA